MIAGFASCSSANVDCFLSFSLCANTTTALCAAAEALTKWSLWGRGKTSLYSSAHRGWRAIALVTSPRRNVTANMVFGQALLFLTFTRNDIIMWLGYLTGLPVRKTANLAFFPPCTYNLPEDGSSGECILKKDFEMFAATFQIWETNKKKLQNNSQHNWGIIFISVPS